MPERDAGVLVVGAGVIGAAVFRHLAVSGRTVTLIDCRLPGLGGTGYSGGVVRCFHEDSILSDRAVTGWRFLRDMCVSTGADVPMTRSGFLYFPSPGQEEPARAEASRLARQMPVTWLDADEVDRRFGHLVRADGPGAVWEPDAGYLDPVAAVRALVRAGQAAGGHVVTGVRVLGPWRHHGRLAGVHTSAGRLPGQTAVLAAGAGTPKLCEEFGVRHDLYIKAIQVDLWHPAVSMKGHPSYADGASGINGRPDPDSGGVYVGYPVDPGRPDSLSGGLVDSGHTRRASAQAGKRLRWLADSTAAGGVRAIECFTRGRSGQVRRAAEEPAIILATGFNGSGFRMAPWAAVRAGQLLATDETD
jgi:glycine/D-amino acid oxidase-like deaminating enzyme